MTPTEKRDEIKTRMTNLDVNACQLILASNYTGLRYYLQGGDIKADNLYAVEQALDGIEAKQTSI